ncbi:MAG: YebC/PmpR family DNA-binding transcriptional regulator [Clostridia bacterium]|nr:YebC/PmpR family DNA-binding transcriptional regulator [Clostridia bacterium]
MSGHSKWNNIKRTKEKSDAKKGKIFTKLGREIAVVVKQGGSDPNANPRLKDIIYKAKQANMPNDTIERSIKKAAGETGGVNYEDAVYEGYGIGGSAVIVECLTDNKNRTAGDVRHFFDKFGGSLGSNGCVSYLFKRKGLILIEKTSATDVDTVMMDSLEADALDVVECDDVIEIYTEPATVMDTKAALEQKGYALLSAEATMIADNYVELDEQKLATFTRMIEALEDLDDVQEVYHNVDNYEE